MQFAFAFQFNLRNATAGNQGKGAHHATRSIRQSYKRGDPEQHSGKAITAPSVFARQARHGGNGLQTPAETAYHTGGRQTDEYSLRQKKKPAQETEKGMRVGAHHPRLIVFRSAKDKEIILIPGSEYSGTRECMENFIL